ncbi:hypothetical protein [Bosea sp. (in: a-proteobacteria)]|uniref:hypothetical protein n=1 Tax=Bosea sp. (in: a-proteobacteria) TaxID=1871050 RepID=UPI002FC6D785
MLLSDRRLDKALGPLALLQLAVLLTFGCVPEALAQEARFRLDLAWVTHEIEPVERARPVHSTFLVTLSDKGKVSETFIRSGGGRRRNPMTREREAGLGDELGGRFAAQWRVVNQNTLVRVAARPSHTFAIWLRTDGSKSCTISVEWRLKPGFTVYEGWSRRRRVETRFSHPTLQQATCEVL